MFLFLWLIAHIILLVSVDHRNSPSAVITAEFIYIYSYMWGMYLFSQNIIDRDLLVNMYLTFICCPFFFILLVLRFFYHAFCWPHRFVAFREETKNKKKEGEIESDRIIIAFTPILSNSTERGTDTHTHLHSTRETRNECKEGIRA